MKLWLKLIPVPSTLVVKGPHVLPYWARVELGKMLKIFVEVGISVMALAGIASWVCGGSWVRYDSPATMAKALVWVL